MKHFCHLLIFLGLFGASNVSAQVSDTSVLLNSVTIIYEEDPAFILWESLMQKWPIQKEYKPANASVYMRQYDAKGAVDFEVLSNIYFEPTLVYQEISALKDYQEQQADFGRSVQANASFSFNTQFDFSKGGENRLFNTYPYSRFDRSNFYPFDRINDASIASIPIIGLFERQAWSNYSFTILSEWKSDTSAHAILYFKPKENRVGWTGQMKVDIEALRVDEFSGMVGAIDVEQTYGTGIAQYISNQKFTYGNDSKTLEVKVISINECPTRPKPSKTLIGVIPEQQVQGPEFWAQYRPKDDKLDQWTSRQDSIIRYLNSDEYLDSADAEYNAFHWYEPLVSGIGYRKRSKGTQFYYSPLLSQINYFGVGGTRWTPLAYGTKRFKSGEQFSATSRLNYGLRNQDLKGSLDLNYIYAPLRNASWNLKFGNDYQQITQSIDLTGIFSRSNYIEKTYAEAYHRFEWFNGFYTRIGFEYSKRESIEELDLGGDFFNSLAPPAPFETYTVGQVGLEVLIRPFQRYYLKGRHKIVLSSRWPDFRIVLKQGIPGFLNSDVRYSKYEFIVEDYLNHGTFGFSNYLVSSGGFLNDPSTVRFIEYKWFRGGDFFLFTHPLYTFQSLPETFASPEPFVMVNGIHHFEGFFLQRIPIIRRLKLSTAIGGAMLTIPSNKLMHIESYAGLERKFKMWDAPTRLGLYYSVLPLDIHPGFRVKFGMDFKDTFTDRWNF